MAGFRDARLKATISVALLIGLLLPVGLVGWYRLDQNLTTLESELHSEHQRILQVLARGMQDPIWNLIPQGGAPLLDAILYDQRVTAVRVDSSLMGEFLLGEYPERRDSPELVRSAEVIYNGTPIGEVTVEMNRGHFPAQISALQSQVLATTLLQMVLGLGIMMVVMNLKVLRPLRRLVTQSEMLASNRLDQPFEWLQRDELGDLGRSFEQTRRSLVRLFRDLDAGHAAQRESDQRFRAIAEAVPVAISIAALEGHRILFANRSGHRVLGLQMEKANLAGQTALDFYADPNDRLRLIAQMQEQGAVDGAEVRMKAGDGKTFWALISMRPLMYGVPATLTAVTDITQRKHVEMAVRESEATLRAILRTAADAIISIDEDGRIVEFNPAAERIFGYRKEDVIGSEMAEVIIPKSLRDGHTAGLRRFLSSGNPHVLGRHIETEGQRKSGEVFPVELAITEVPLENRRIFAAYLRDISERRRTENELEAYRDHLEQLVDQRTEALKAAEERLVTAINTFHGGFALYGSDERLVLANDRMVDFFPDIARLRGQEGVLMADVTRLIAGASGQDEAWVEEKLTSYRNLEGMSSEMMLEDGRWVETSVRHGADGSILFVITDISSHREAAATLHDALEKSRELAVLQREFVSMASHEFRTPLAIIDAVIQRILRRYGSLKPAEMEELGHEVRAAVARMVGLIDAILSSSRLESGLIKFAPQAFDLAATIRAVCKRQEVIAKRHVFIVNVEGLPARVDGDASLIDQVMTNLVSNAVKYSPQGGAVTVRGATEGELAVVAITDQGVGIPKNEISRLFQRFFRARTSTGIAGTGLGLPFVDRVVRMHGGSVAVDSTEGLGTTFTVRLPIIQQNPSGEL